LGSWPSETQGHRAFHYKPRESAWAFRFNPLPACARPIPATELEFLKPSGAEVTSMQLLRKKEQVDKYFLDFLDIRSNKKLEADQKIKRLDNLFQRAVEQMTSEKLDKSDFHILSRLIQQELTMMRFHS
jgi:hypothetical protein